jgi:hypothetical protein
MDSLSPKTPEGRGSLGWEAELRREKQRLSWTGERVDRDGTVDDLCEGFLAYLSLPTPARLGSHMIRGQVGPSRRGPDDELG